MSGDVWFVVALPVFLEAALGWRFWEVGGLMGLWLIGYGIMQSRPRQWFAMDPALDALLLQRFRGLMRAIARELDAWGMAAVMAHPR